jgi:nucleotide-binding universal stress UspA family protein
MTTRLGTGRPVVVGVDGSDLSTVALAWGVDDARRRSLRSGWCIRPATATARPARNY